ncbi:hypothetical protein M2373_002714 [Chryseobacterium sp. JUb7]|nr:hypothetical protein [Chryseobacterium sp. JUb7]
MIRRYFSVKRILTGNYRIAEFFYKYTFMKINKESILIDILSDFALII